MIMQLRYDDDFLEAAVFVCASGRRAGVPALQVLRFHRAREKCYTVLDPDERNAAFFKVHLDWFREWGLEEVLAGVIKRYPLVKRSVSAMAFRQAKSRNEEGAELFVQRNAKVPERNAVIALRTERFERDESLMPFLHRELMHLHDMVDPAFGYSPFLRTSGPSPTQQRIARQRYRLLWEVTIDARLARSGATNSDERERHQMIFDRAYSFWPEAKRHEVFEELWRNPAPRHAHLLALAADPRDLSRAHEALPGAPCPLCSFPTFEWAPISSFSDEIIVRLQREFPHWRPEQGCCARCMEVYENMGRHELPATVLL